MGWFGLIWAGLGWFGLVWVGLGLLGLGLDRGAGAGPIRKMQAKHTNDPKENRLQKGDRFPATK